MSLSRSESIVVIDKSFKDVLSEYEWHINYLHCDNDAIRIEYELTPPVPMFENENDVLANLTTIWGDGVDDLGNTYESVGGAFGLSDDKLSTKGVISFFPLPNDRISSMTFSIGITQNGIGTNLIEVRTLFNSFGCEDINV